MSLFFEQLASWLPRLPHDLRMARIEQMPASYLKNSLFISLLMSFSLGILILILAIALDFTVIIPLAVFLFSFIITSYIALAKPAYLARETEHAVESEIVSAVRFLILELKTEQSLYSAIVNTSKNFSLIGIYFDEIIDKVKMGKTLEESITEAAELCPSTHLRNIYWQLLNSLQTGADITEALHVQLGDIIESQNIKVQEYGRELNALSLFYMMVSIIIPTVGFTIITAVLTFVGFSITLGVLIGAWALLTIIQYFFLMLTAKRRPAVEAY